MRVAVLIVADDRGFRGLMKWLLETALNVTVVSGTGDSEEAIRLVGELRPDVVLIDIGIGLEAIRRIKAERPETRVVVLSDTDEEGNLAGAQSAGDAVLPKQILLERLLPRWSPRLPAPTLRPGDSRGTMYVIIGRPYASLEEQLRTAFAGQEDVEVIVDRRYGERRTSQRPVAAECRRSQRRGPKEELAEIIKVPKGLQ